MIAPSFVECLGWTLLHSIWQLALLTLLHEVAQLLLRNRSPQMRYLLAGITMLAMLGGPLGTCLWQTSKGSTLQVSIPVEARSTAVVASPIAEAGPSSFELTVSQEPAINPVGNVSLPRESQFPTETVVGSNRFHVIKMTIEPFLPGIVGVWLAGVLLLSCRQFGGWWLVERLRRCSTAPVDRRFSLVMVELSRRLGVHRTVDVLESALLEVPSVVGWLRPAILLPLGLVSRLPPDQLEAILLHELAHIRRRDYLVNGLQIAVETLLFYHPGVWWVSRRMRLEREFCADDLAATACGNRLLYAKALTTLDDQRVQSPGWAVAATGSDLRRRIERLLGVSRSSSNRAACWMTGIAAALLLFAAAAWGQIDDNTPSSVTENQNSSSQEPLASVLEAHQKLVTQVDNASDVAGENEASPSSSAAVVAQKTALSEETNDSLWDTVVWLLEDVFVDVFVDSAPIQREYVFGVETNDGRPIAGATVTFTGLGLPGGSSVGGLSLIALVPVAKSDADGNVRINLSRVKSMFRRARSIFLEVDHPDYPPLSAHVWIGDAPAPGVRKIVLAPSQTIEIRAHLQGEAASLRGLYPQLRGIKDNWSETDGVLTIDRLDLSSEKASRWLRVVHAPEQGPVQFSDVIDLTNYKEAPISIDVALKPGVSVKGRLSDDVPRPIKNGRVIAAVYSGPDFNDTVFWGASAEIAADGTFVIKDLPANEDVQLIALCDGWVSQSPTLTELDSYIEKYGLDLPTTFRPEYVRNGLYYPRLHRLSPTASETVIPMERTSACEVTVVDANEKPVPNATVVFYAQQSFFRGGAFELGTGWDMPANLRARLATGKDRSGISKPSFEATTDEKGVAVVSHLAGGVYRSADGSRFHMSVAHPDYLMQNGLLPSVTLQPGETGRITVKLSRR
ncbi:MAG: M56 family metallopeptidase [Planctomycetaceae bacterium]